MEEMLAGGSCHALGEALDFKNDPMQTVFKQGCISFTLDELVSARAIPVPKHIKIDIDGFEPKVIAGARTTLGNSVVRSVLIELNVNRSDHRAIVPELQGFGFRYDPDQVRRAMRTDGPFKENAEHVFRR